MATKKYVSLTRLEQYHEKEVLRTAAEAAATLAAAKEHAEGLAVNYDAAGAAATVQSNLDSEIARAKSAEEANAAAAKKAQDEVDALELVVDEIQKNAYDDSEIRGLISGLEENKADKTQVATDIAAAVKAEEDARKDAVAGVQGAVDTLSGTHAADKTALEASIALKADQSSLDEVAGVANAAATKEEFNAAVEALEAEDDRIEGLVAAETERATDVEADLEERIEKMEVFWDTTEDADGVVNKLKEIQEYIASDESGAAAMAGSIQENAQAISDMDAAYKAADATLQSNIDKLSGTVDTKAAASDVEELEGRMDDAEAAIEAVEGRMDTAEGAIAALQDAIGDGGSVAEMIEEAIADEVEARNQAIAEVQADADKGIADAAAALTAANNASAHADELNAAMNTRVNSLETASATHATKTEVEAVAGRTTTLEADMAQAKSDIDAVEALAAENKTATETNAANIAKKAAQSDLDAAVSRIAANETAIANFVECSEEDVNQLFE